MGQPFVLVLGLYGTIIRTLQEHLCGYADLRNMQIIFTTECNRICVSFERILPEKLL